MMRSPENDKWVGHDTEHLSINFLAATALLTGDRFAREEVDHHALLYLTGFTHGTGSWNDTPGPARKVGRSTLAAIWIWLVTGREDVRQRVIDRVDDVAAHMSQTGSPIPVVAPRGYWSVWEEGNAVTGIAAVHHNFGTPAALDIVYTVSQSVTMRAGGVIAGSSSVLAGVIHASRVMAPDI